VQPISSSPGLKRLLERRRTERAALIAEAKAYAERVRSGLGEARVFLYGSVARGDFNLASDLDLLVVSARLPRHPLERLELLQTFARGREEPKGLLPDEYHRLEKKGRLRYLEGALEL
jgi:uncharacterized protein